MRRLGRTGTQQAYSNLKNTGSNWQKLSELVDSDPFRFLGAILYLDARKATINLGQALDDILAEDRFEPVIEWKRGDERRISMVPPGHWLLIRDPHPFQLRISGLPASDIYLQSIFAHGEQIVSVLSNFRAGRLLRYANRSEPISRG